MCSYAMMRMMALVVLRVMNDTFNLFQLARFEGFLNCRHCLCTKMRLVIFTIEFTKIVNATIAMNDHYIVDTACFIVRSREVKCGICRFKF